MHVHAFYAIFRVSLIVVDVIGYFYCSSQAASPQPAWSSRSVNDM